ncbi:senescence-associated carboxylesterase 101-like [Dorcoceras hygrometricum]|uniref:Senescence-associated carboxylesterase 101-like n=1 Tax=Dorcoceras hygrometricum TaxID=472368 RepID=A0A2Z7BZW7_9LAMI|nr:senescence-associated carboxylesterase 101-like [Dorcoceras hygrometricum]
MTRRSMNGVLRHHNDPLKQFEEMRAQEDREKESLRLELEATRADAKSYKALAQSMEVKVQCSEKENRALQAEVEKLQGEVANSWQLGKEKFLQYKEFDSLCSKRGSVFFEQGFNGCLAQFKANGHSEGEHPASFLEFEQALADMPEDSGEDSSGSEEAPPS